MERGEALYSLLDSSGLYLAMLQCLSSQLVLSRRFLKDDVPSILYKNPTLSFKQNRPERIADPTLVVRYGGLQPLH